MAIGYFNAAIVGRTTGSSSVHAAAYASRQDLTDERRGITYRYSRKSGDVVASWVWVPKNAPESLRDRAALWNAVERAETRKNSQLARRIILALPHELTPEQQQHLLKDFVRGNFVRKGLAADVSIHKPDLQGDTRNHHAHILIPTRYLDKNGIGKKDRDSNDRKVLEGWKADWAKQCNRQLERYGHAARVSFDVEEGHDPQVHRGQAATALERKGVVTRVGDMLRKIVNDNDKRRAVANDLRAASRKETQVETVQAEPETIDRDQQDAAWQEAVDQAGIDAAEAQRQAFIASLADERQAFENNARAMTARHATAWNAVVERYHDTGASYQGDTIEGAAEATSGTVSLVLSWFAGLAESITGTRPARTQRKPKDRDKEQAERRQQQQRELEALMVEQAQEREAFERRRQAMLDRQSIARGQYEDTEQKKWGALPNAFDREASMRDAIRDEAARKEAKQQEMSKEKGPQRGPDRGPEL